MMGSLLHGAVGHLYATAKSLRSLGHELCQKRVQMTDQAVGAHWRSVLWFVRLVGFEVSLSTPTYNKALLANTGHV